MEQKVTPIEALTACQNTLVHIPYTIENEQSVGQQLKYVFSVIEQVKNTLIKSVQEKEEANSDKEDDVDAGQS